MALQPKPGTVSSSSNVTPIHYYGQLRVGGDPSNNWPVVEILSYGIERTIQRSGIDEQVKFNRTYFTVPKGASRDDEIYRLSNEGFTFEVHSGMTAIQSNIVYSKGNRPGLDVITACLLQDGSSTVVNHEPTQLLTELWLEFNQRQRYMNSHDLAAISDQLRANPKRESELQPQSKGRKSYKRIPPIVWDDTGISTLAPKIGIPAYWLASLSIMVSLIKQPDVNPTHTTKMQATLRHHFEAIESKSLMVKACLSVARDTGGWGPSML